MIHVPHATGAIFFTSRRAYLALKMTEVYKQQAPVQIQHAPAHERASAWCRAQEALVLVHIKDRVGGALRAYRN